MGITGWWSGSSWLVAMAMAVTTALAATGAQAVPLTLDFENYGNTATHAVVNNNGFDFSAANGNIAVAVNGSNCSPTCAANGTTALVMGAPSLVPPSTSPMTMDTAVYATFRLLGFDYAELSLNAFEHLSASRLTLTGVLYGGGSITQSFLLDGLNDGPGGSADFQTATLTADWAVADLVSLQFAGFHDNAGNRAFQLDNIALEVSRVPPVTTVPVPGTLALVGAGLAALVALRRRSSG